MADINKLVEKCLVVIQKHNQGKKAFRILLCVCVYLFRSLLSF